MGVGPQDHVHKCNVTPVHSIVSEATLFSPFLFTLDVGYWLRKDAPLNLVLQGVRMLSPPLIAPQISTIQFGMRVFTGPWALPPKLMLPTPGLYAILVADSNFSPKPFRLLYIGESTNLKDRICTSHEKYDAWTREAVGKHLYDATHVMFGATDEQRKAAEEALIKHYDPPCNQLLRMVAPLRALIGR